MNEDDIDDLSGMTRENNTLIHTHRMISSREGDRKLLQLNSLGIAFNSTTPPVTITAYNRNNHYNQEMLFSESRKDDISIEALKEKVSHGMVSSYPLSMNLNSASIHHHNMTEHSSTSDGNSELIGLQASPPFQSVNIPLSDRGSSSCENSLSELMPTIVAPVNLIENSDSLFDSPGSMKDVFATFPKETSPNDLQKEDRDVTNSSNIINANRLLNNLIQSCKPDTNTHLPLRISEFSKIPNASLRPTISHCSTTSTPSFHGKINKISSSVTPTHERCSISSQEIHTSGNIRQVRLPLLEGNNIHHNINVNQNLYPTVVTNSSMHDTSVSNSIVHHSIVTNNSNILQSVIRNSNVMPNTIATSESLQQTLHMNNPASTLHNIIITRQQPTTCNTETSFSGDFSHRSQSSSYSILAEMNKDQERLLEQVVLIPKESRYMNADPRHDQLISAPPHTPNIGATSQLSFISDQTHDQILAQFELPNDGPKDLFLQDLHSPDENELLEISMATGIDSNLSSNTNPVVSESNQNVGIENGPSTLSVLPPSPILASISSSDFLLPKTSPSQSFISMENEFPFFNNLFDSSGLCMEGGLLAENDATMHAPSHPHPFVRSGAVESPRKGKEINFTNVLKLSSSHMSLVNDGVRYVLKGNHESEMLPKMSSCVSPSSDVFKAPPPHSPEVTKSKSLQGDDPPLVSSPIRDDKASPKPVKDDSMPMVQVSCFKCQICSFLSLDKNEMSEHNKLKHREEKDDQRPSTSAKDCDSTFKSPIKYPKKRKESSSPSLSPKPETFSIKNLILRTNDKVQVESTFPKEPEQPMRTREKSHLKKINYKLSSPESSGRDDDSNPDDPEFLPSKVRKVEKCIVTPSTIKPPTPKLKQGRSITSQSCGSLKFKKGSKDSTSSRGAIGTRCGVDGCGLRLQNDEHMLYHRMCHVDAFLNCPECREKFALWSNLAMHLWKKHLIDIGLHKCQKCSYKAYSYNKLMNNHFRTHSDERPFLCDVCGKDFKIAKQLRSHKLLHTEKKDEMRHHCDMCQRRFAEKRMLLSHLETVHKKIKPYLCNYCGNSFASRSTLNLHIRVHTGEKPFACEHCNYRTSDHNSMRRHRMKHTNARRYSCPYCDYTSIQSSTFKVHLKRKHDLQAQKDGVIFSCPSCPFKTVKQDNILAHMGTFHQASEEDQTKSAEEQRLMMLTQTDDKDGKVVLKSPSNEEINVKVELKHERTTPGHVVSLEGDEDESGITTDAALNTTRDQIMQMVSCSDTIRINGDNFIPVQSNFRNGQPQTFYIVGELLQLPHVVNIDVNNETSEVQQASQNRIMLQPCDITNHIQGPLLLTNGEQQYVEMRSLNLNDGIVQLTPEVIAMPVNNSNTSSTAAPNCQNLSNIIYVESSSASEDQISSNIS